MNPDDLYRAVMMTDPPNSETPFDLATRNFLFAEVWARPGLSIRERRLVTLASVCAADAVQPINDHVYAALKSGDLSIEAMNEFTLHFAVYCGWPKASQVEMTVRAQWQLIHEERGGTPPTIPSCSVQDLGEIDLEKRIEEGARAFEAINLVPSPPPDSPYFYAGILNFVFGHLWLRPGLSVRERRLITVPCVGVSDAAGPIYSHVTSALGSGDITYHEMQEVILQFSAYSGFAKGQPLREVAARWQGAQSS